MSMKYTLIRFNPRRADRGVGAAEVEVGDVDCGTQRVRLWMTLRDIRKNLAEATTDDDVSGLQDAEAAYKASVRID